ncbi:unnamed protein product [Fraxinus pennsylvanica]|uniref:Rho termination factor-like N-terminal domain-containing protein n=1 Tax=Fraxinus pennsylvanica TaxID=56036 RepID=A0AAD1ZCS8_9LAMI|nr:unnamed protein product [Fraxinus pennsylvanica]
MQRSQPHVTRPASNFRKRSPVPQVKFQPIYSDEGSINSLSRGNTSKDETSEIFETDNDDAEEVNLIITNLRGMKLSELRALAKSRGLKGFSNDVLDQISEDETSEIFEINKDDAEEVNPIITNLSGMKLSELRALAKSRGLKGFSKMKKQELIELLSGGSI